MNREEIRTRTLEAYRQGPDAVVELVLSLVTELATTVDGLSARLVTLPDTTRSFQMGSGRTRRRSRRESEVGLNAVKREAWCIDFRSAKQRLWLL